MRLDDTYRLPRASRYSNPLAGADRLPLVYGNCYDGSNGVWKLPCVDTVNYVYVFSGIEALSVANGNAIEIYTDGVLVDPGNYTFEESDNYDAQGLIATITFTSDQANAIITAKGKGAASGTSLVQNVIDIIVDFLTVQNDYSAANIESTAKATARDMFDALGYVAAGVIDKDIKVWELLQKMMGSFLGSAYLNGKGKLVLMIDDGNINQYNYSALIPQSDIDFSGASQKIANVVNRCDATYRYDYVTSRFAAHTDDNTYGNIKSQGVHGTLRPNTPYQFYWCRNQANVQTIQQIITDKFGGPVWVIDCTDITPKRYHVEVGDLICCSFEQLYDNEGVELRNGFFRVLSMKPDYRGGKCGLRIIDTGKFLTASYCLADGTYLADGSIKAGGERDMTVY